MANIGYALDVIGNNPLNKVTEIRTLSKKVIDGRLFVIPKGAPYFAESVVIYKDGVPLVRDHDYKAILHSEELSHTLDKNICGGIIFNTLASNDSVTIEVQTVGGDFNLPMGNTVENMVRVIRNPIFTTWSQLVGTPTGLPTWSHTHDWGATVGFESFSAKFDQLYLALLSSNSGGDGTGGDLTALMNHLESTTAHSKSAVGLGNISNFKLAQDADYNTTPYPNDKYVTPRSVMYAIDRFIGNTLLAQKELIDGIQASLDENTSAYNTLITRWEDLRLTLNVINNNYTQMVNTINGYTIALTRFEAEYKTINDNQVEWLARLQEFNTTLTQYSADYTVMMETKNQLLANFQLLKNAYDVFVTQNTELNNIVTAISNRVGVLESHAMYPDVKVIPTGSYNFRIKPNEKYAVTLIGAGGGVGEFITDDIDKLMVVRGEAGSTTSLWCLQDRVTGNHSPSTEPVAKAEGGYGGNSSFGADATHLTKYGIGGRGGAFKIQTGITVIEASAGEGGITGYGNFKAGINSQQDTGYELYGGKWGRGGLTEDALGQGGEGAITRIEVANTTPVDLEFMVVVGTAGRSYNPDKTNATGGLAVISKIKVNGV